MDESRLSEIKSRVSIPAYFYNIIIPQMSGYYDDYTVNFEARPVCKCPIHDEATPSMRYFEETNTFYCYGCRNGGDILQLHRKFTEVISGELPSFDDSIDFLYQYFIRGNENKQIIKAATDTTEYKSSMKDLMRLSGYCSTLEGQLLVDKTIREESKRNIWEALDQMNLLASKNLVNALEAMKYIKSIVRTNIQ